LEKKFVVFATSVEFKAHQATEHGSKMTKAQQREARRLEVDLFQPPPRREPSRSRQNDQRRHLSASGSNQRGSAAAAMDGDNASSNDRGKKASVTSDVAASAAAAGESKKPVTNRPLRAPPGFGSSARAEPSLSTESLASESASHVASSSAPDTANPLWPALTAEAEQMKESVLFPTLDSSLRQYDRLGLRICSSTGVKRKHYRQFKPPSTFSRKSGSHFDPFATTFVKDGSCPNDSLTRLNLLWVMISFKRLGDC
jgi:hypothetical protein